MSGNPAFPRRVQEQPSPALQLEPTPAGRAHASRALLPWSPLGWGTLVIPSLEIHRAVAGCSPLAFFLCLQQHYMDSQIPCVFVASKTDLPEASQQPGLSPAEFCYKHCLPPPFLFSCHSQGPPGTAIYTKLATAATFPLVSVPWGGVGWELRAGGCSLSSLPSPWFLPSS